MHINDFNQSGRHGLLFKTSGALLVMLLCGSVYAAPPANDECETATVVASSAPTPPWTSSTDATDATFNPADPQLFCNSDDGTQTVWYEYTPDASETVNITTVGSTRADAGELDTAHGAFVGSCGNLVPVSCVDQGLNDDLIMDVEAGVTYYIKVGQFAGGSDAGTVVLSVEPPPEPVQVVLESTRDGVSAPLSVLAGPQSLGIATQRAGSIVNAFEVPNMVPQIFSDAILAQPQGTAGTPYVAKGNPSTVLQSFEGASNNTNAYTLGVLIAPPDTIGDVGPDHYVQMVNLVTTIYNKDGSVALGPFGSNSFFAGLGGACEDTNRGDPVVLYDEETDRWLVTQFAFPSGPGDYLCVAVSTSGDPTGSYYQHEFTFTGIGFPDYPKYGFATDSINVMVNLFSPFQGAGLGAIDKAEAMSANPTTMVFYIMGASEFGFIPGDNDGPVFDNTKPTFFSNNGGSGNRIDVWEINPDYDEPTDSTITEVAKIPVAPWSSFLCGASRGACIAQPGSGTGDFPNNVTFLESLAGRLMHRGQTRDFGKRKKALLSHTVAADENGKAGVHWYELWNNKDNGWMLKKEETYSPDSDNRWMGSIAMNAAGQTCLGYSISSQTTHPSIGIAGRNGTANHMNVPELVAFDGNDAGNVQRRTARWGDYSAMSIDPVDDSCWFTTEYALPNDFIGEQFGWGTKILQFTVPGGSESKK